MLGLSCRKEQDTQGTVYNWQRKTQLSLSPFIKVFLKRVCKRTSEVRFKNPTTFSAAQQFEPLFLRTPAHPEFTEYRHIFYPQGKKGVPPVSYLLPRVTYQSLAYLPCCDGSVKSDENKSMEIHLQSFSEQSVGRLCIALREKLQIKCAECQAKKRREGLRQSTNGFYISAAGRKSWHLIR